MDEKVLLFMFWGDKNEASHCQGICFTPMLCQFGITFGMVSEQ